MPVQADGAHQAIGDEGCAGQVAGVFEHSDEQEQQQDLWQKDEHGLHAIPQAIAQQSAQPVVRQQVGGVGAGICEDDAETIAERLTKREHNLEDADDDGQKEKWAPEAVKQDAVETDGPDGRRGLLVAGGFAHQC